MRHIGPQVFCKRPHLKLCPEYVWGILACMGITGFKARPVKMDAQVTHTIKAELPGLVLWLLAVEVRLHNADHARNVRAVPHDYAHANLVRKSFESILFLQ